MALPVAIHEVVAFCVSLLLALSYTRILQILARIGAISALAARKLLHMGIGPLYLMCWILFPAHWSSPWVVSLIPAMITVKFALAGLGVLPDPDAVASMSRSGSAAELLKGPFFYGLVHVAVTWIYWFDSCVGVVVIVLLCIGDGAAEVVGRKVQGPKWPWSQHKTLSGSLAMLISAWFVGVIMCAVLETLGGLSDLPPAFAWRLMLVTLCATLVESLSSAEIDNLTVPGVVCILGHFLLR